MRTFQPRSRVLTSIVMTAALVIGSGCRTRDQSTPKLADGKELPLLKEKAAPSGIQVGNPVQK